MALFGTKKNTKKVAKAEKVVAVKVTPTVHEDLSHVIVRPRITEKASTMSERGVYVFDVSARSSKISIAKAVQELYNVTPVKIAITGVPAKQVIIRGRRGIQKGGKKAYVYLAKGDKIEFV